MQLFSKLWATAICVSLAFIAPATAQDVASFYKGKTIRIIVGFTPGGGYDVYARALARHYGRHIPGNPTIVVQEHAGRGEPEVGAIPEHRRACRRHADHDL
jgi:tripartite-type tricarboxylate transporter receptor subunit TctC